MSLCHYLECSHKLHAAYGRWHGSLHLWLLLVIPNFHYFIHFLFLPHSPFHFCNLCAFFSQALLFKLCKCPHLVSFILHLLVVHVLMFHCVIVYTVILGGDFNSSHFSRLSSGQLAYVYHERKSYLVQMLWSMIFQEIYKSNLNPQTTMGKAVEAAYHFVDEVVLALLGKFLHTSSHWAVQLLFKPMNTKEMNSLSRCKRKNMHRKWLWQSTEIVMWVSLQRWNNSKTRAKWHLSGGMTI